MSDNTMFLRDAEDPSNNAPPDEQKAIDEAIEFGIGTDKPDVVVYYTVAPGTATEHKVKVRVTLLTSSEIDEAESENKFGYDTFWYEYRAYRVNFLNKE